MKDVIKVISILTEKRSEPLVRLVTTVITEARHCDNELFQYQFLGAAR